MSGTWEGGWGVESPFQVMAGWGHPASAGPATGRWSRFTGDP